MIKVFVTPKVVIGLRSIYGLLSFLVPLAFSAKDEKKQVSKSSASEFGLVVRRNKHRKSINPSKRRKLETSRTMKLSIGTSQFAREEKGER